MASVDSSSSSKVRDCLHTDLKRIEEIEELSFEDPYPLSLFQKLLREFPWGFRVALSKDIVVGYCVLVRTNDYDSSLLIASIAVDPAYRRRGIGTDLIEDAISIGRTHNRRHVRRIVLQVRENNESAISLYSKIGFRSMAIIPDYYGVGKDALEMSIDL